MHVSQKTTYRGSLAVVPKKDGTQRVIPGITTHAHAARVLRASVSPHARTTVVPAPPSQQRQVRNSALLVEADDAYWIYVGKLQDVRDLQQRLETGRDEMIHATSFVESHRANVRAPRTPPRRASQTRRRVLFLAAAAVCACACGAFVA